MSLLRKVMLERRKHIPNRPELNRKIYENFFRIMPEDTKRVFIYVSVGTEADTRMIIETLFERGITVAIPKSYGVQMDFFEVRTLEGLKKTQSGVLEPALDPDLTIEEEIASRALYPDQPADLMILPGVVYDERGGRIGYGLGFYDRYLENRPCYKIALGYEDQVMRDPLPLKKDDVLINMLITDAGIRTFDR
ncbi:MAG: 5-formyltetrahydrofolate cyclo-ligase [Lachnospiraceae bacterium]|nr:5-formyltetrahydrofolate cyclo-ligase [Lachnospiraceae bacterium]